MDENVKDLEGPEEDLLELDKRIEQAYAAQSQLIDQSELEAQAEQLPILLQQKEEREQKIAVDTGMQRAIETASRTFAKLALEMPSLKKKFADLMATGAQVAQEIKVKQEEILTTGAQLNQSVQAYGQINWGRKKLHGELNLAAESNSIPDEWSSQIAFEQALVKAGGMNPDLGLVDPGTVVPEVWRRILWKNGSGLIYLPERGVANFMRKF